jgi:hypothetical protein
MSGYDKHPDYGGDRFSWWPVILVVGVVGGFIALVIALLS